MVVARARWIGTEVGATPRQRCLPVDIAGTRRYAFSGLKVGEVHRDLYAEDGALCTRAATPPWRRNGRCLIGQAGRPALTPRVPGP